LDVKKTAERSPSNVSKRAVLALSHAAEFQVKLGGDLQGEQVVVEFGCRGVFVVAEAVISWLGCGGLGGLHRRRGEWGMDPLFQTLVGGSAGWVGGEVPGIIVSFVERRTWKEGLRHAVDVRNLRTRRCRGVKKRFSTTLSKAKTNPRTKS